MCNIYLHFFNTIITLQGLDEDIYSTKNIFSINTC